VFEPGAGGEHKRARGFAPTRTHSAHWIRDPQLAGILEDFVSRERRRIDAFLRGDAPEPDEGS
jgi:predicted N-acyltransferase